MAVSFPSSPTNGDIHNEKGRRWIYDSTSGAWKSVINSTTIDTDTLLEGTNLFYTDERVDDRVSTMLIGGNNITTTYNDAANTLTIDGQPGYTDSDVDTRIAATSVDALSDVDTTTATPNSGEVLKWNGSNWAPAADIDTTLSLGSASVGDFPDVDITTSAPTSGQALIWDNANSKFIPGDSFSQSDFDSAFTAKDTDALSEGTTNLYYTDARADARITAADTDALSEGSTNLYYTDARVGAYISSDRTYGNITIESTDAGSAAGPDLVLYRNSASPASGDYIGQIQYVGENSNGGQEIYAKITGKITDETLGTEDGLIETAIKGNGSFTIVSRQRSDELQLINGVGLSVAGNTTLTGTLNSHTIPGGTGTVALTSDIPAPIPDTDSLSEGSTNLYYTDARADARVTAALATDVIIGGNLTVNGTTTTLNTATLDVEDLNITVASGAADAAAADGAGLTVAGANATITYDSTNDEWDLNKDINVTGSVRASQPFFTNSQTVTENHTVATGESAMAAGPVTVNSGVTVTVSSGSRWVIV